MGSLDVERRVFNMCGYLAQYNVLSINTCLCNNLTGGNRWTSAIVVFKNKCFGSLIPSDIVSHISALEHWQNTHTNCFIISSISLATNHLRQDACGSYCLIHGIIQDKEGFDCPLTKISLSCWISLNLLATRDGGKSTASRAIQIRIICY